VSDGREREPSLDWRRVALGAVLALLVGAGVVLLIGRAAGYSELSKTLRGADPEWLAVCAIGQLVVFAGYAGVYRAAVRFEGGPEIGTRLSLRVVLASFGLTQLVAAGGAAALAVTYWALRRVLFPPRDALVRLIGLNTLVYLVFGLIGLSAALAALVLDTAPVAMTVSWIVVVPVLLVAARWFTAPVRVAGWARDEGGWARRGLAVGVSAAWWVRRAVAARDRRALVPWALAYWAGDIASLWGGLRAFGVELGLSALVLAYATGYVAQSLPIPFVATGGVDAATTFALVAVGVPLEQALLGVVAHRVFAFWLPLVPGLILAALLPGTGRRLEAAAAGAPHVEAQTTG
jgi:uncharacterized membrane protein YbhN (UPF0104 family)